MALGLEAAVCNVVGLVLTLIGGFVAGSLGVPGFVATGTGIIILAWALVVTLYANRRITRRHELDRVIIVNGVVIVIAILAVVLPSSLSSTGRWMIGIGAAIVLVFLATQIAARRTLPLDSNQEKVTQ